MADNLSESADDVKYTCNSDVKHNKNLYPVFMKEFQNYDIWSAAMDLRRTDMKQKNMNVNRLTFVFEHVNKYTIEKKWNEFFEWYNL